MRAQTDEYAQKLYYESSDWLLHQPGVTAPIIGASKIQHLDDLAKAVALKLSEDELKSLNEPYKPHPVLGHQ